MMRVETETEKIVAVLPEVVEGSRPPPRWEFDELRREGFSESVLAALECVTRREGESYEEFIRRSLTDPAARRGAVCAHSRFDRRTVHAVGAAGR